MDTADHFNFIDNSDTKKGKLFIVISWFFILLSVIVFSISTLPNLDDKTVSLLKFTEFSIAVIFLCEYVLRIYTSTKPFKFIFSFYGLVDLISIVPVFFGLANLQSMRVLRVLRLIRILKLTRHSRAIREFTQAINSIKDQLLLFLIIAIVVIYISSVGIYYFEHIAQPQVFASIIHSLWWSVATLTTVGYGDIYPVTAGGKVFTFFILMVGLGIVAIPTALIASAITKQHND